MCSSGGVLKLGLCVSTSLMVSWGNVDVLRNKLCNLRLRGVWCWICFYREFDYGGLSGTGRDHFNTICASILRELGFMCSSRLGSFG
ncbi:hypothetical protein KC19_5G088900 [Ceratodon purpureus]|uniref:Secreted protein n=1 Tax=Ceratodon purpureus TaxID=3225 RepID=A0A8T0I1T2_CERPU|nr:hypothetical protein KC19_5G088900 [Ceratodon purpureus]